MSAFAQECGQYSPGRADAGWAKLYKQPDATQWIFGGYVSLFKPPMSFLEVLRSKNKPKI